MIIINKLILTGRLVKDAEVSNINNQMQVMKYTLAVERDYTGKDGKKPVDFINCEQIGKDFSKLSKFVTKGKLILCEGSLNIDKVGEKYFTKAKINKLELLGGATNQEAPSAQPQFEIIEDDDTPF